MDTERVSVKCPGCGKALKIPRDAKRLRCKCGFTFSSKDGKLYKGDTCLEETAEEKLNDILQETQSNIVTPTTDVSDSPPPLPKQENVWFYSDGANKYGPMSILDMEEKISSGVVKRETLVWQKGWPDWRKAIDCYELEGVLGEVALEPPPIPRGAPEKSSIEVQQSKFSDTFRELSSKVSSLNWAKVAKVVVVLVVCIVVGGIAVAGIKVLVNKGKKVPALSFLKKKDFSTPSATVNTYMDALRKGDMETVIECLTYEEAAQYSGTSYPDRNEAQFVSRFAEASDIELEIVQDEQRGNEALVRGFVKSSVAAPVPIAIFLIYEEGKWKMDQINEGGY